MGETAREAVLVDLALQGGGSHGAFTWGVLDRLSEERTVMRPLPERMPDVDRRFVTRIAPDPYVRVDSCDYSLDPRLVGRRSPSRSTRASSPADIDARSPAIARSPRSSTVEPEVEKRPLARYDALIPA